MKVKKNEKDVNKKEKLLNGISLFSSAGIGELYFSETNINIVVANELLQKRANLYKYTHPNTEVVIGDICNESVFSQIMEKSNNYEIEFMLVSPPCQGFSVAGKNRTEKSMQNDGRNYLILKALELIKLYMPSYIIIENVPSFLTSTLSINNKHFTLLELLNNELGEQYNIEAKILDSADYGIPQRRKRAITKLYKKSLKWEWPQKTSKTITVRNAIGNLPSLEAGDKSNLKWHFARPHSQAHIKWMQNTPTGKSAFENKLHFPQKDNGAPIKGYQSSYRRIKWDEPAPTITMRNDAISSQRNVHPGNKLPNGLYSDARVLTPLELMLINSMPPNWNIPSDTPEILIRQCIGESIPPLLLKKIVENIDA